MKVSILLMAVATASALLGAAVPLSVGTGEDYGGAAAEWKPSFKARGFNLQGMRRAGSNAGFKEEHFKWMKEWGFNFVRMPLDYRCWVKDRKSANREIIDEAGLKPLDAGIAYARKHGIVAMICLHRIPGEYCVAHVDPEPGNIYKDADCLRAAVLHWTMLARRYKDVPREELFFNLINEPARRLGSIEDYERVCRVLIAAIRKEDPKRFIVVDGWDGGNVPVPGLYGVPGVGQAGRGYRPASFTHFGFTIGESVKDDRLQPYPPAWPPPKDCPVGRLWGPRWKDLHEPFTVQDAPAADYRLCLQMVSGPVTVSVQADGAEVASFALEPKEGDPAWTGLSRYQGKGALRGTYLKPLAFTLGREAKELSIQVVKGDWARMRKLVACGEGGAEAALDIEGKWGTERNVAWRRRFAGWGAAEPFPAKGGSRSRATAQNGQPGGSQLAATADALKRVPPRFVDEGMNVIFNEGLNLWEEPLKKGMWCVVGEFGCANHTAHADSLRFLESSLRLFNEMGMGWCCWGFIGSRFGILNSQRRDVKYEDWHGSKLDRKMLELLRRHGVPARKQRGATDTTWWDPYVENITDTDTYLRRKFRQDVTDKATGLDVSGLKKLLAEIVAAGKSSGESWYVTKAKCFAVQAEKMSIDVSPLDWFPAIAIWNRNDRPIKRVIGGRAGEVTTRTARGPCGRTSTTRCPTGA